MNIALALLFILQLHSIQLQPTSGVDGEKSSQVDSYNMKVRIMLKMINLSCNNVFSELKRTTNFQKNIQNSLKVVQQIKESFTKFNVTLNKMLKENRNIKLKKDSKEREKLMIRMKKIKQNITNAKNPFEKLVSMVLNIKLWMNRLKNEKTIDNIF
uniref:SJCHGC03235 protein n=1 Tax=Schistosoma japonicum TaxID=6182 RepID=Q5D8H0_SCHJA|nr:SJCHGC03235 protein [Schistosoma japonicum]